MINSQIDSPIGRLPTELRLEVYRHMLADFDGTTTDVKGALLACHLIKSELDDVMARLLSNNVKATIREVEQAWRENAGPLRIVFPHPKDIEVHQMMIKLWLPKSVLRGAGVTTRSTRVLQVLGPLFKYRLKRLVIALYEDEPLVQVESVTEVATEVFGRALARYLDGAASTNVRTRRIDFQYGTKTESRQAHNVMMIINGMARTSKWNIHFETETGKNAQVYYGPTPVPVRAIWTSPIQVATSSTAGAHFGLFGTAAAPKPFAERFFGGMNFS
jgi:hypothetical protein